MWMCFLEKKVVSCRLRGCGSVLCHLNEWLSILLCLCVLRLFVFALWIFGKITCISDVFSVRLYTTLQHDDPQVMKHWSQSLYSSCFLAHAFTHIADIQTHRCMRTLPAHTDSYKHIHAQAHPELTNTHTLSVLLVCFSPFFMPPCESQRSRLQLLLSAERGGRHALLCVTPPLFPPGLNFKSNEPPFSTSIPSSPPLLPLPFSQIWSLSTPLLCPTHPPFPLLHPPPFSSVVFLLFFPLYKVFQIYHLYIMMYGYDNVLYYGKMRKIYFCYRFVS